MTLVLEGRKSSWGADFGKNVAEGLSRGIEKGESKKKELASKKIMNDLGKKYGFEDFGGYSPDIQKELLGSELSGKRQKEKYDFEENLLKSKGLEEKDKVSKKNKEDIAPFESGLSTIKRMREIRKKGNIGYGSKIFGLGHTDTRKDRAEYETLGNSLISLASTISPRNQKEFEVLTGKLNDPGLTLSEIDGVLDGIERIINQNKSPYTQENPSQNTQENPSQKPPLSSFRTK